MLTLLGLLCALTAAAGAGYWSGMSTHPKAGQIRAWVSANVWRPK